MKKHINRTTDILTTQWHNKYFTGDRDNNIPKTRHTYGVYFIK